MKPGENTLGKIWWFMLPLMLYYFVNHGVVLGLQSNLERWEQITAVGKEYLETVVKMLGMFLGAVAVYPFYQKENSQESGEKKDKRFGKKEVAITLLSGMVIGTGLNVLFYLLNFTQSSQRYAKVAESQFGIPVVLAVVFYGILSPVAEELVFRGILYRGFKRYLGRFLAALGSALLFGGFHGNMVQMVYAGIMGILLAFLYEKYETICAPVLFHGAANIAVYILSML